MRKIIFLILVSLPFIVKAQQTITIFPQPLADRTFQYVKVDSAFSGIPLRSEALLPNVVVVVGREESPELILQAGQIAFMLGQWVDDAGTSLKKMKQNVDLAPILFDDQINKVDVSSQNFIVLGKKNQLFKRLAERVQITNGDIQIINDYPATGSNAMFVLDLKGARYLANKRLFFKAGAYKSFFAFVKMRLFIEKKNLAAALFTLDEPEGVRGCAKPVLLALSQKDQLPKSMLAIAQKRNRIVFKDLKLALKEQSYVKAKLYWHQAMETCYTCHQGTEGLLPFRKFKPNPDVHSYHKLLAKRAGITCQTCHYGKTKIVGY